MEIDSAQAKLTIKTRRVNIGTNIDVLERIGLSPVSNTDDSQGKERKPKLRAIELSAAEIGKLPIIDTALDPDTARKKIELPLLKSDSEQIVKALALVQAAKQSHTDKQLPKSSIEFYNFKDLVREVDIDHVVFNSSAEIIDENILALAVHYTSNGDLSFLDRVPKGFIDPDKVEASTQRAGALMKLFYASKGVKNAFELENLSNYRRQLESFGATYLTNNFEVGYLIDASVPNWMHDETDPILRPWRVANGVLLKELENMKFPMIDRLSKFVARRRMRVVRDDGRLDFEKLKTFNDVAGQFRAEVSDWKGHSGLDEIFPLLQKSFPQDLGYGSGQIDDRLAGFKFIGKWDGESGHERFRNVTFRSLMDAGLGKNNPNTKYTKNGFELHYTLEEFLQWRNEHFKDKDWEAFFENCDLSAAFHNFNKSPVKVHGVLFPKKEEASAPVEKKEDPIQSPVIICGADVPLEEFMLGNSGKVNAAGKSIVVSTTARFGKSSNTLRVGRIEAKENRAPKVRKPRPPKEPRVKIPREPRVRVQREPRVKLPKPGKTPGLLGELGLLGESGLQREFGQRREPRPRREQRIREPRVAPVRIEKPKPDPKEIKDNALAVINFAQNNIKVLSDRELNEIVSLKETTYNAIAEGKDNITSAVQMPMQEAGIVRGKINEAERSAKEKAREAIRNIDRKAREVRSEASAQTGRIAREEAKVRGIPDVASEELSAVSEEISRDGVLQQAEAVKGEITQAVTSVQSSADEAKNAINTALCEISEQVASARQSLKTSLKPADVGAEVQEERAKKIAIGKIRRAKESAISKSNIALKSIERAKANPKKIKEPASAVISSVKAKVEEIATEAPGKITPIKDTALQGIGSNKDKIATALSVTSRGYDVPVTEIEAAIKEVSEAEANAKKIVEQPNKNIDVELGRVLSELDIQEGKITTQEVKINAAKDAANSIMEAAVGGARTVAESSNTIIDTAEADVKAVILSSRELGPLEKPVDGVDAAKDEIRNKLQEVADNADAAKTEVSNKQTLEEARTGKERITQIRTNSQGAADEAKGLITDVLSEVSRDAKTATEALRRALVLAKRREEEVTRAREAAAEKAQALVTVIKAPCERKELPACRMQNDNDDVLLPSVFKPGNVELISRVVDAFVIGSQNPSNSSLESLLLAKLPGGGGHALCDDDIRKLLGIVEKNIDDFDKIELKEPAKVALSAALNPLARGKDDVRNILLAAYEVSSKGKLPENTDSVQILDTFIKYIIGNAAIRTIEDKAAKRKRVHSSIESPSGDITQRADRLTVELEKHWSGIYHPFRKSYSSGEEAYFETTHVLTMFASPGKIKSEFYRGVEMIDDERLLRSHIERLIKARFNERFNEKASNKAIEKTFMRGSLFERDVEYIRKKCGLVVSEEVAMIALGKSMEDGKNITLLPEGLINPNNDKFALRVSALWRFAVGS
jgi:hypothetical protein